MSEVYERLENTAVRLISEFGRTIAIRNRARTLDATSPWDSTLAVETVTDYSTDGVFLDEGSSDLEARLSAVSRLVLSPVEVNQTKVLVAARDLAVVPTIAMEVVDGSRTLAIKQVMPITPGDTTIMYTLIVEN